jgi:hypothetical protein
MTDIPSTVAEQTALAWAEEPDCNVLWVTTDDTTWIAARDGRARSFTGHRADEEADALARQWARELGGSWKYAVELDLLRKWREAGSRPEDKPQRWTIGFSQPRRAPTPPPMPMPWQRPRQCEASLSADSYRRHTSTAEYDHEKWLWMDGNHERCPNPVRMLMPTRARWVGLCSRHDSGPGGQYFPYITPGEGCSQPCCRRS